MAKRRKEKDEDEDKPFKMPKFDEQAFLKRERRNIKATFIAFLFGILMGFVCFGFWALMGSESTLRWALVVLVCIANAAFIRYLFLRFNIDLTDFTKKNWFVTYAVYFFTWLLIFIVLVNPPFYDDETPLVAVVALPGIQEPGGNVTIVAKITDNVGVEKNDISLVVTYPEGNTATLEPVSFEFDDTIVKYVFENPDNILGDFQYSLTVKDVSGREAPPESGVFSYDEYAIDVTSYRFENLTHSDDVEFEVDEDISTENFRVYYTLNDGEEINVNRKNPQINDEYETSPEYEGWVEESSFTMKVYVEVMHYFTNIPKKYNNTIEDTNIYNFTTTRDSDIGDEPAPVEYNWTKPAKNQPDNVLNYKLPFYRFVQVPGFEVIMLIVALAIVVIILKRKNKDEKK
jgi:hypothetical protein